MPGLLDFTDLLERLNGPLAPIRTLVPLDWERSCDHGDLPRWLQALHNLPALEPDSVELAAGVRIGSMAQLDGPEREQLQSTLMHLHPWRKGPLEVFGLSIDTEWRSDWKWDRLLPHITPLAGRTVLDVGCGNAYHCWRMAGAQAGLVLGVEPSVLFNMQYWAIKSWLPGIPVYLLPNRLEDLPLHLHAFDTVFSMGVLYHRKDPLEHLHRLRDCLRPGGELVLETLICAGQDLQFSAGERYARMGNVWHVPTADKLLQWLHQAGFVDARLVDSSRTSVAEQRSTAWMQFESLAEALDPDDRTITVEGYPAPVRGLIVASLPA